MALVAPVPTRGAQDTDARRGTTAGGHRGSLCVSGRGLRPRRRACLSSASLPTLAPPPAGHLSPPPGRAPVLVAWKPERSFRLD